MTDDLYATLGIPRDAQPSEVKRAFRSKSKTAHPDRGGDREKWGALIRARDVLSDEKRREKYDRTGQADDEVDNIDANAFDFVFKQIDEVLNRISQRGGDPSQFDVIGDSKRGLRERIAAEETKRAQLVDAIARHREIAKRFRIKKKNALNRIRRGFEAKADEIERAIAKADESMRPMHRAVEILEEYAFDYDASIISAPRFVVTGFGFR